MLVFVTMLCATTLARLSAITLSLSLSGFSSRVSNVSQLEMSKQDDRGTEESANQTSVSGKRLSPPHSSPDIVLCPNFSLLLLPTLTVLCNLFQWHDRSLQANPIHSDCICHRINHPDTIGLGNKGVIKSKWLTHVHVSTLPYSQGVKDRLKTEKGHQASHTISGNYTQYYVRQQTDKSSSVISLPFFCHLSEIWNKQLDHFPSKSLPLFVLFKVVSILCWCVWHAFHPSIRNIAAGWKFPLASLSSFSLSRRINVLVVKLSDLLILFRVRLFYCVPCISLSLSLFTSHEPQSNNGW